MSQFQIGEKIYIECSVSPGPFSDEKLVEFKTIEGTVSGFVNENGLRVIDGASYLLGEVLATYHDSIDVRVNGSFFTTNGIANIAPEIASAKLDNDSISS